LTYIMFLGENKCVCLIFIGVLIVDALRVIKMTLYANKKKSRPDIKEYLVALKWVTFAVLGLIISGSFFYNIVRWYVYKNDYITKQDHSTTSLTGELPKFKDILTWMDYFLLFFQKEIRKNEWAMPRIVVSFY
jgi:transposase